MKVVCIIGSPRKNGSTAFLVDKILEGIDVKDIKVSKYYLGELNISFCKGCKVCHQTGLCTQDDDMKNIVSDVLDSDIVIIGSPSYWGDVTGQLKVFFDRNTPFSDTNPKRLSIPKARKGISIAVRAGRNQGENSHIIETIEHYFGHMWIEPFGRLSVCGVTEIEDLYKKETEINEALEIGARLSKNEF